jgi:predicted AlkP superfamily phosphohydrolase/phosphomutase
MVKDLDKRPGNSCQLILLGLDGACWPVIKRFSRKAELAHINRLLTKGAHTNLLSIIPPVTGPAWPAVATGLNPGRLGTFDFYNRQSLDDYTLFPVRSQQLRGRAFWDRLANQGYRVGIFGYPMLVPAYEIDSWMVAGLGASKLQQWVWPANLANELDSIAQPYTISISYGHPKYENNREQLLEDLSRQLEGQLAALAYLLREHPVDVLVAVLGVTDVLSHTMWHLWDPGHPQHDARQAARLLPRILALWTRIDQAIGRFSQSLASNGHLLIISDHGFGPSFGVFNANVWLERYGFLKRQAGSGRWGNRLRSRAVAGLSPYLAPLFKKLQGTSFHAALRESILREIDLEQTRAFALETIDLCGMIFVNRAYARARNIEEKGFIAQTQAELQEGLSTYGRENGLAIEVFLPQDLYHGRYAELAPELLFTVNDFKASVSYRFGRAIYEDRPHLPMKTGTHRREGIFLVSGPKIQPTAKIAPLDLLDIAPTIYHLLGEPVPAGLDGRVALEALLPEFRQVEVEQSRQPAHEMLGPEAGIGILEEELMRQRLQDLGYLD